MTLTLAAAVFLIGCRTQPVTDKPTEVRDATSAEKTGYPVTITDSRGKRVAIPSEPKRIVSLTPSHTEILYALGLGEQIVGVTGWCDYPEDAAKKTRIGDMNTSVEKVVSLEPDLIIAHATLNDSVIRQFEGLGKIVVALDPKTIAQVRHDIRLVGLACGRQKEAEGLCRTIQESIDKTSDAAKGNPKLRVLIVIQPTPLWAAGPKTLVDEMLSICNVENIAHDARPGFNTFPVERALARDPQIIVVGKEDEQDLFLKSPVWKNTSAVRSRRVVIINPDLLVRPGPRIAEGLERLAAAVGSKQ